MYAEFLKGLGDVAEKVNEAVKIGGGGFEGGKLPTPYIAGQIELRLDGEPCGYLDVVDEWVQYESGETREQRALALLRAAPGVIVKRTEDQAEVIGSEEYKEWFNEVVGFLTKERVA